FRYCWQTEELIMNDVLIVFIVFSFITIFSVGIYKLIMAKMKQTGDINKETFDRLARAFMQHKKDSERRIQNLETIISEERPTASIELEEDKKEEEEGSRASNENNLRNMLHD